MHRFTATALLLTVAAPTAAQTTWTNLPTPAVPGSRCGHDLVATGGPAVLFGGQRNATTWLGDTWSFDVATFSWSQHTPASSPRTRTQFEMAYDPGRDRIVLFGGWSGSYLNDTWEWDGVTWTQMTPTNVPPGRDWTAMAYDPNLGKVVMFGGHTTVGWPNVPNSFGDMWAWDGSNWTPLTPATMPFMRFGHEMELDTKRGRIVMWGGASRQNGSVQPVQHLETWEWDGSNWTQIATTSRPTANTFFGMAYDPRRERTVCYGGLVNNVATGEVWEYDGIDWTQRTLTGVPLAAGHVDGCFHAGLGRVVNFGGTPDSNRATTYAATDLYGAVNDANTGGYGVGCAGSAGVPALDCTALAWLGGAWSVAISSAPANAPLLTLLGFSASITSGGVPLPFDLTVIGMPGCRLHADPLVAIAGLADGAGRATQSLSVGTSTSLIGIDLYSQAIVVDPSANTLGLTTSNACAHHIGDR